MFAEGDDGAADEIGGQEADHGDQEQRHDQPEARHRERQIGVRVVACRNIGLHPGIDPADERPGDIGGDRQRRADDEAGQEIIPEPGHARDRRCGVSDMAATARLVARNIVRAGARVDNWNCRRERPADDSVTDYSTVTDFARLRGWSTSVPMNTAV